MVKPATLLQRIIAYGLDTGLGLIGFALTQWLFFVPLRQSWGVDESWFYSGLNTQMYTLLTASLPFWLYFIFTQSSHNQATLGMRVLQIRIISVSGAEKMTRSQALARTAILLLPWEVAHLTNNLPQPIWYSANPDFRIGFAIVPLLITIYLGVAMKRTDRRSVHDLVAGTMVVPK